MNLFEKMLERPLASMIIIYTIGLAVEGIVFAVQSKTKK